MSIIIEKLRALIKMQIRREELNFASLGGGGQTMNIGALEWVLKQLDTLQEQPVDWQKVAETHAKDQPLGQSNDGNLVYLQEHPACEGLEEEINDYMSKHFFGSQTQGFFSSRTHEEVDCVDIVFVARHFAQWQKEQDEREKHRQEWISENDKSYLKLDSYEYIIKCALDGVTRLGSLCDDDAILDASRLCAKHIKEQMMKEAVEGDIGMILHDKTSDLFVRSKGYLPKSLGIKCDDKVRIVIVKED